MATKIFDRSLLGLETRTVSRDDILQGLFYIYSTFMLQKSRVLMLVQGKEFEASIDDASKAKKA